MKQRELNGLAKSLADIAVECGAKAAIVVIVGPDESGERLPPVDSDLLNYGYHQSGQAPAAVLEFIRRELEESMGFAQRSFPGGGVSAVGSSGGELHGGGGGGVTGTGTENGAVGGGMPPRWLAAETARPRIQQLETEPSTAKSVEDYLLSIGWERYQSKRECVAIFRKNRRELLVPLDRSLADYADAVSTVVVRVELEDGPAAGAMVQLLLK